jgi:hypothetical protein
LHEYELGRARDAPKKGVKYGQYLLGDFDGRKHYEWELPEKEWWLRKIQKVDMWEREQRRYWFRACNKLACEKGFPRKQKRRAFASNKKGLEL